MLTVSVVSAKGRELAGLWSSAAALAALGVALNFGTMPGLNWPLWTIAVAIGFAVALRAARKPLTVEIALALLLACIVSGGAAVTANPLFYPLIFGATVLLLGTALRLAGGASMETIDAGFLMLTPFVAGIRTAGEALHRTAEAAELARAERLMPLVRGIVFAIPVVIVFALLLSGADPVFAAGRDALGDAFAHFAFLPQLIMFGGLGAIVLGAYGYAVRPATTPMAALRTPRPAFHIGDTERLMVLGGVAALFALFLALQVGYLFGNPGSRIGSGITFADAARHGFGELTVVATLCALLIVVLDRWSVPGARDRMAKIVALALVFETQLLLHSAYRRMDLYADAYGYTSTRLYVQIYLAIVSLTLIVLAWEVWGGIDVPRLTRRAASLVLAALIGLTYWNHEAWIVRQNVARFERTGTIDAEYLTGNLSLNAVPEITRAMRRLPPERALAMRAQLRTRFARGMGVGGQRWVEWSARRGSGIDALLAAGVLTSDDIAKERERRGD